MLFSSLFSRAQTPDAAHDTFTAGDVTYSVFFIGHGSLMFDVAGYIVYVDPVSSYADFSKWPKADLVLLTHDHSDHYDPKALDLLKKAETRHVVSKSLEQQIEGAEVMKNGDRKKVQDITIEAFPSYNTVHTQFHPRSNENNGYILTLGTHRVYVAGDCEDMPELADLKSIDVAFLPVNQPYTMTVEQAEHAIRMLRPGICYPYHYSRTDLAPLIQAFAGSDVTELRIRNLQ